MVGPFKRRGRREAEHTGDTSSAREESPGRQEQPAKSRRPANTALRQQRLLAWSPVLTPKLIILIWSIAAVFFLGLGGWLFYLGYSVRDLAIDYTDCVSQAPNVTASGKTDQFDPMDASLISAHFLTSNSSFDPNRAEWQLIYEDVSYDGVVSSEPFCNVRFNIPESIGPSVLFYYNLQNFYQNHRRYVQSFDSQQLSGTAVSYDDINNRGSSGGCNPLTGDATTKRPYFPCGLIANSLFNDTFGEPLLLNVPASDGSKPQDNQTYPMTSDSAISWSSEAALYTANTSYNKADIVPPPNWVKRFPKNYTDTNPPPDLKHDFHFQNWMRTAAVPNFSKLFMRNDNQSMTPGQYQIKIGMNYDVEKWNGRKAFQISTLSLIGGRNLALGIIFLVVGGFCLLMDVIFVVGICVKPRKLGDHTYLSWNQAPGQ